MENTQFTSITENFDCTDFEKGQKKIKKFIKDFNQKSVEFLTTSRLKDVSIKTRLQYLLLNDLLRDVDRFLLMSSQLIGDTEKVENTLADICKAGDTSLEELENMLMKKEMEELVEMIKITFK